jgi:hypothetical protein
MVDDLPADYALQFWSRIEVDQSSRIVIAVKACNLLL